jgi:hypothetical protein
VTRRTTKWSRFTVLVASGLLVAVAVGRRSDAVGFLDTDGGTTVSCPPGQANMVEHSVFLDRSSFKFEGSCTVTSGPASTYQVRYVIEGMWRDSTKAVKESIRTPTTNPPRSGFVTGTCAKDPWLYGGQCSATVSGDVWAHIAGAEGGVIEPQSLPVSELLLMQAQRDALQAEAKAAGMSGGSTVPTPPPPSPVISAPTDHQAFTLPAQIQVSARHAGDFRVLFSFMYRDQDVPGFQPKQVGLMNTYSAEPPPPRPGQPRSPLPRRTSGVLQLSAAQAVPGLWLVRSCYEKYPDICSGWTEFTTGPAPAPQPALPSSRRLPQKR